MIEFAPLLMCVFCLYNLYFHTYFSTGFNQYLGFKKCHDFLFVQHCRVTCFRHNLFHTGIHETQEDKYIFRFHRRTVRHSSKNTSGCNQEHSTFLRGIPAR